MTDFNEALTLLVVCQRSIVEHDGVVHEEIDAADFRMRVSRDM